MKQKVVILKYVKYNYLSSIAFIFGRSNFLFAYPKNRKNNYFLFFLKAQTNTAKTIRNIFFSKIKSTFGVLEAQPNAPMDRLP